MSMKEYIMYAYTTLQYSFSNSRMTPHKLELQQETLVKLLYGILHFDYSAIVSVVTGTVLFFICEVYKKDPTPNTESSLSAQR